MEYELSNSVRLLNTSALRIQLKIIVHIILTEWFRDSVYDEMPRDPQSLRRTLIHKNEQHRNSGKQSLSSGTDI